MLKKPTFLLILVLSCSWLLYLFLFRVVPDETRIRWVIEEMAENFNDGDAAGVGDGLAADFFDKRHNYTRRELVLALLYTVNQHRRRDGSFSLRAELLSPPEISVHDEKPRTANVTVDVRIDRLPGVKKPDSPPKTWRTLRFHGQCVRNDGTWEILSSTYEIINRGRPLQSPRQSS